MIVILGTPRSGTSLTAELLWKLGFDLGPLEDLDLRKFGENPRGKWESRTAVGINQELFRRYRDNQRLRMPWEIELAPELAARMRSFEPEVVKDPRFCYTLGAWIQAGVRIEHVIWCWRHPARVERSFATIHPEHRFLDRGPVDHAGHLIQWLLIHQLDYTIVRYPEAARDPRAYEFLIGLRPGLTREAIEAAHREVADPGLIRFD